MKKTWMNAEAEELSDQCKDSQGAARPDTADRSGTGDSVDHRIQTESEIPGDRTYKEDPGDSSRRLRRKRRWQSILKY